MVPTRGISRLYAVLTLAVVSAAGWWRWAGDEFRRPLDVDEVISLKYYTWAGVDPSGGPREIRRIEDLRSLPRPGARHFAIGLYCGLGRWTEPNNHVVNSVLMNTSLALGARDEARSRLPALLGALAFAGLMAWASLVFLGTREALPLVASWALWCPYVVEYSQSARGYTWMLALMAASWLAVERLARCPDSLALGALSAAFAVLSAMNVVSLAIDWLVPFYITLWLWPTKAGTRVLASWRKNIAAQALALGAIGFVFLMDRLPYVVASAEQYGIEAADWADRAAQLGRTIRYLFPTPGWLAFAGFGLVGLALPVGQRARFIPRSAVAVLAVGMLHLGLAHRLPYERVYGYTLPFLLFGAANSCQHLLERTKRFGGRVAAWAALIAATLGLVGPPGRTATPPASFAALGFPGPSANRPAYCLTMPDPARESIALYLPEAWGDLAGAPPSPGPIEMPVLYQGDRIDTEPAGAEAWSPASWSETPPRATVGAYRLVRLKGSLSRPSEVPAKGGRALIFWYPDPARVAVFPRPALVSLDHPGVRFLTQQVRHQVKLDVYSRLGDVILITDSPAEYQAAAAAVAEGVARCGGTVLVFTTDPTSSSGDRPVSGPRPGDADDPPG